MATKKPTRRTPTRQRAAKSAVAAILNKASLFKTFSNYGLGGCVLGYLLIWTIPEAQKAFTDTIEKQAATNREDRKSALDHGEKAVERLATAVDKLGDKFGSVQSVTQGNQAKLLIEQKATNTILENIATGSQMPPRPRE